jgi:REP element-mobilizing transposase RayT
MRRLRYVPPDSLVEVTCRTLQGSLFLRPSELVNELVLGVLARAVRLYPVELHGFAFLSNHFHLLVTVASAQRLAAFMQYLNSNLAREIGRVVGWRERFFGRRYQAVLVDPDERCQIERLLYLLSQGTKENLVASPREWPGASSTESLLDGKPIRGRWVDRTLEYRSRRAGRPLSLAEVSSVETLELAPLPCWRNQTPEKRRALVAELVEEIEQAARARRRATGIAPLGRARIARQLPQQRAQRLQRRPAPLVHAVTSEARRRWRDAYRSFYDAYRCASDAWRRGARDLLFPEGAFWPPAGVVKTAG